MMPAVGLVPVQPGVIMGGSPYVNPDPAYQPNPPAADYQAGPIREQWLHAAAALLASERFKPAGLVVPLVPTGAPRQSTRLLKIECPACGCVARITARWLTAVGAPSCGCPDHATMIRA